MLERLSVPRRALDFEDYVDIVRRNIRWIIGPAFAGLVVSTVVAFTIEETYESTALVRVVPQQISESVVHNISAQDVSDRINGMAEQMLSRSTLGSLITTYGLYKSELKNEPMEDVLTKMKAAILIRPTMGVTNIQSGKNVPAMQVQFSYRDRFLAQKVCADLVSRFMSASSVEAVQGAVSAQQFLQDEYNKAKRDLDAAEQKLSDYRMAHNGALPEQVQTNIAQMSAVQQRLGGLNDALTRNAQIRMELDTQLHIAKDRLASVKTTTTGSLARNEKALELERDIDTLQSTIASMQDKFTDNYPDLQAAKDRLAVLKRERDEALKAPTKVESTGPENAINARERLDAQAAVEQVQSHIRATEVEEAHMKSEIASLNGMLAGYQARIQQAPAGEKEYADLTRDRDVAKQIFEQAQQKKSLADTSVNITQQKQGETMELLDNANTPSQPSKPNRYVIIPIGLVAGILLGFILVAIREVRDTSLKNLKDARLYTQLSILGSIPLLENDVIVQRRKQMMWVGWATATLLGLAIMGGSVAHYYLSKA